MQSDALGLSEHARSQSRNAAVTALRALRAACRLRRDERGPGNPTVYLESAPDPLLKICLQEERALMEVSELEQELACRRAARCFRTGLEVDRVRSVQRVWLIATLSSTRCSGV